ncbi:MAG: SDR family oxidoreductase [Synechococcales bacterium]|nr:SDR family oxidoreductase [Synechococcales bacterium]
MVHAVILGCGYVGKAVARHWQSKGLTVTATTTHPEKVPALQAIAHQAIVLQGNDAAALRDVFSNTEVLLVSVGAPSADAYEATYLETAKTLVSVLPDTAVRQVIYTGSYAVYGDQGGAWVDEETAIAPANRNGEILAETEEILLQVATDQRAVCVLRLGGIYGPGRELARIFSRAAGSTRPGDGSDASNWIHLDDIVGAIAFAEQHRLSGVYNLVQTDPTTTGELINRVLQAQQLPPVTWDASQSSTRPYNARVSNQKLRDAGYTLIHPTIDLGGN